MATLDGVHPELTARVTRILAAMDALGYPMVVTAGVRTVAEQQRLYAQGRTAPGDVVTHCDGVQRPSPHQPKADGFGHAVDCAFMVNGAPSWNTKLPWACYGAMALALGLVWGGQFKSIVDMPHVEWRG